MNVQNLIIYKLDALYHILEELGPDLNFNIIFADSQNSLNDKVKNLNNYLIISDKIYLNLRNQIVLRSLPINIFMLVERINIELLKLRFTSQSEVKINKYIIDLNSREMLADNIKLKLTQLLIYQN